MPRKISIALSALFFLFALSALSAQQQSAPQARGGQKSAAPKRVNPDAEPREAQSAAQAANRSARQRRTANARQAGSAPRGVSRNAPVRIRERSPENPVRFAFAPHREKARRAAPMPWDENPSAAAVMSTFLTGEISPELVSWHVNQRKKALYEKMNETQFAAAPRGRAAAPQNGSEYGEMLRRMEFAWTGRADRRAAPAGTDAETDNSLGEGVYSGMYDGEYAEYADPSNGSILVQLLTGYKNGEMKDWRENRMMTARREAPRELPAQPMRPLPQQMYAYGRPLPPSAGQSSYAPAAGRAASENIRQAELADMPAGNGPVRVAAAQEPRFVDDGFPAGTSLRRSPIRQVSAEIRTPAPGRVLNQGESVRQAGQIRVYAEDEDGWSPAE